MEEIIIDTKNLIQQPKKQVFTSQVQCAAKTGFSVDILRFLKKNGAPGFVGSKVYWDELKSYIDDNKQLIEDKMVDSKESLKLEGLKLDNDLKKLEKKKRQQNYLEPTEVKDLLIRIGISMSSIMKKWPAELAPKLAGKNVGEIEFELNQSVIELMSFFKTESSKI